MASIGIDLGTTNSAVGTYRNGSFQNIKVKSQSTMPSNVHFPSEEEFHVGSNKISPNTIYQVKRIIGKKYDHPSKFSQKKSYRDDTRRISLRTNESPVSQFTTVIACMFEKFPFDSSASLVSLDIHQQSNDFRLLSICSVHSFNRRLPTEEPLRKKLLVWFEKIQPKITNNVHCILIADWNQKCTEALKWKFCQCQVLN